MAVQHVRLPSPGWATLQQDLAVAAEREQGYRDRLQKTAVQLEKALGGVGQFIITVPRKIFMELEWRSMFWIDQQ